MVICKLIVRLILRHTPGLTADIKHFASPVGTHRSLIQAGDPDLSKWKKRTLNVGVVHLSTCIFTLSQCPSLLLLCFFFQYFLQRKRRKMFVHQLMRTQFFGHFDNLSTIPSYLLNSDIDTSECMCQKWLSQKTFSIPWSQWEIFFSVTGKMLETCAAGSLSTPDCHYVFNVRLAALVHTV